MSTMRMIEDLQQTNANLMKQNELLRTQLHQAVEDIRTLGRMGQNVCPVCAYHNHGEGCKDKCITCIINKDTDNFRWRGENA